MDYINLKDTLNGCGVLLFRVAEYNKINKLLVYRGDKRKFKVNDELPMKTLLNNYESNCIIIHKFYNESEDKMITTYIPVYDCFLQENLFNLTNEDIKKYSTFYNSDGEELNIKSLSDLDLYNNDYEINFMEDLKTKKNFEKVLSSFDDNECNFIDRLSSVNKKKSERAELTKQFRNKWIINEISNDILCFGAYLSTMIEYMQMYEALESLNKDIENKSVSPELNEILKNMSPNEIFNIESTYKLLKEDFNCLLYKNSDINKLYLDWIDTSQLSPSEYDLIVNIITDIKKLID